MGAVPQGQAVTSEVPKITSDQLITRHLAAGHLLSNMLFPDNLERCRTYEIIFRTKFADSWSERIARLGKEVLEKNISDVRSLSPDKVPSSIVDPFAWVRRWIFDRYLLPFGGAIGAALSLKDSPSEQTLKADCARRWL